MLLFDQNRRIDVGGPIVVLLIISGVFMFAYAMMTPVFAIFVEEIGGGVSEAANAYAVFWATAGVLTFIIGKLEDKLKKNVLAIVWSQFLVSMAYVILFFVSSITWLYLAMFVMGVGNAFFWPAFHAVYGQHTGKKHSTAQWSLYDGLAYLVPSIGAALGGWLIKMQGFTFIFAVMAILTFLNAVFILLLPKKAL